MTVTVPGGLAGGSGVAPQPLWSPTAEAVERSNMRAFARRVSHGWAADGGAPPPPPSADYDRLHAWSIAHPERFWAELWRFCGVIADEKPGALPWTRVLVGGGRMAPPDPVLGPRWFEGARLNFAENLLRDDDERVALVSCNERGRRGTLTYAELRRETALFAGALRALGVRPGDRVAGFLPNIVEGVIAMLGAAAVGATWSSCSPDFGAQGVVDRFGQIEPRVLVVADGYLYGGKEIDSLPRIREIAETIGSIERVVVVGYLRDEASLAGMRGAMAWSEFMGSADPPSPLAFERLPFDHPLYVMYSSGTTGLPKCMVHGAGGTLLQHLKEHMLHGDLRRDDTIFYFTTCGWMMWNWLVSALAVGATVVLYDGNPLSPSAEVLWEMAARERVSVFGTSAKYLALLEKDGARPGERHDLSALKAILSTGSPLATHSYDYVYERIRGDVRLSSISGGTDIISCFALGNPTLPVWRGELQSRGLGMAVDVWDGNGRPVRGAAGELVCTHPFPSMPVRFWNDPGGWKYRDAYFGVFPGVWRHGDWAEWTEHGGLVIHGRSDATLNPGGVRIGTAEIYRQVERIPEVVESLVIDQVVRVPGEGDTRIVLFVRLAAGVALDDALRERIRGQIRDHASPHHVPKKIVQVADIPRTISGKITELAVREVVHGRPVMNRDALANPEALELFRGLPELAEDA
ncbi:MAG: acetoacetate--CoA ligase [Gemmatimonadaceae bacterium]